MFISLGDCKNGNPECTRSLKSSRKPKRVGTWVRVSRIESQVACYGRKQGHGCPGEDRVSLLTEMEQIAIDLLYPVLLPTYTTNRPIAELVLKLRPDVLKIIEDWVFVLGNSNRWAKKSRFTDTNLPTMIKNIIMPFLSMHEGLYLRSCSTKELRWRVRELSASQETSRLSARHPTNGYHSESLWRPISEI